MGRSGMKRKGRKHLPKVRASDSAPPGTIPLGQDRGIGPWGAAGYIQAWGKIARAFVRGTPRQRRAGGLFLLVLTLPVIVGVLVYFVSLGR
jgi:hypothetical protein